MSADHVTLMFVLQGARMAMNGFRLLASPQSALKRTQRLPAAAAA